MGWCWWCWCWGRNVVCAGHKQTRSNWKRPKNRKRGSASNTEPAIRPSSNPSFCLLSLSPAASDSRAAGTADRQGRQAGGQAPTGGGAQGQRRRKRHGRMGGPDGGETGGPRADRGRSETKGESNKNKKKQGKGGRRGPGRRSFLLCFFCASLRLWVPFSSSSSSVSRPVSFCACRRRPPGPSGQGEERAPRRPTPSNTRPPPGPEAPPPPSLVLLYTRSLPPPAPGNHPTPLSKEAERRRPRRRGGKGGFARRT